MGDTDSLVKGELSALAEVLTTLSMPVRFLFHAEKDKLEDLGSLLRLSTLCGLSDDHEGPCCI